MISAITSRVLSVLVAVCLVLSAAPSADARTKHPRKASTSRVAHERTPRHQAAKRAFERQTGYPRGRPGYVVDHIVPLACGGQDDPSNMQWETISEAKRRKTNENGSSRDVDEPCSMISTPTTFIIGAGASEPYGLPVASQLYDAATRLTHDSEIYQIIRHATNVDVVRINQVLDDIREAAYTVPSLDAYLELRKDQVHVMQIGRALIALLMAEAILNAQGQSLEVQTDWFREVITEMRDEATTADDFADGNRNVCFVTFNFDRIVESRLESSIRTIYKGVPEHKIAEIIRLIPIIHVHGRLLDLPAAKIAPKNALGDSDPAWIRWVNQASGQINVVFDAIDDDTLRRAREAVSQADVVCFLGFGYHFENLARLDHMNTIKPAAEIFGSAFGIPDGKRNRIENRFPHRISLSRRTQSCTDLLREFPVFRDR